MYSKATKHIKWRLKDDCLDSMLLAPTPNISVHPQEESKCVLIGHKIVFFCDI